MKNTINWFEIPVKDFDRAKKFYETIFNYKIDEGMIGSCRMGFLPYQPDGISGALIFGEGYEPCDKGVLIYLNANNVMDDVAARIESAGGKINTPIFLVTEDIGRVAVFMDTEGNKIGLHASPSK